MKYTETDVVRAHDTAGNGIVRPSVLWRYMQETANHSMRDEGPSYSELLSRKFAFLLSRMTMVTYLPLRQYQPIRIETWGCPSRGLSFDRCYRVLTEDGRVAAEGLGIWALLDLESKKLCRVSEVDLSYSSDEILPHLFSSCRFRIPSGLSFEQVGTRRIYYSDTDVMGHMNNTEYPDMLCDFLPAPEQGLAARVSISFMREAPLGSELVILRAEEKTGDTALRRFYFETRMGEEIGVQAMIELSETKEDA